MPQDNINDKGSAHAAAKFVKALHRMYAGISVKAVPPYEDEDFTFEVSIPKNLSIDEVLDACHRECIKAEDEFNVFILPNVVYAQ